MTNVSPVEPTGWEGSGLAPLCQVSDIQTRLMRALTTAESNAVPLFIADASALIRRYTGQTFTKQQTWETIRLRADGRARVRQRPVISVDEVVVLNPDMTGTVVTGWWWDGIDIIRASWDGGLVLNAPSRWMDESPDTIQVQYTHGYATVPDDVTAVCAAVAMRRLTEPPAHLREAEVGSYREMYYDSPSPGSVNLTVDDKLMLKNYRSSADFMRLTT